MYSHRVINNLWTTKVWIHANNKMKRRLGKQHYHKTNYLKKLQDKKLKQKLVIRAYKDSQSLRFRDGKVTVKQDDTRETGQDVLFLV